MSEKNLMDIIAGSSAKAEQEKAKEETKQSEQTSVDKKDTKT